jgi:hypothetical protein
MFDFLEKVAYATPEELGQGARRANTRAIFAIIASGTGLVLALSENESRRHLGVAGAIAGGLVAKHQSSQAEFMLNQTPESQARLRADLEFMDRQFASLRQGS